MTHSGPIPRSWRQAAAYAHTPLSSLRSAVKRGDVPAPITGPDGVSVWDVSSLDALRVARAGAVSGAVAARSPVSTTVSATTAMPSAPAPVPMVPLAPWMIAAAAARDGAPERDALSGDEDDEEDAEARQPFNGIPLGATLSASPTAAWPYSVTASSTSTNSPRIAALEQQLADAIAQRDNWFREARIRSLANTIASEAMTASSGDVNAAHVAGHAAAQALGALRIEQLSIDALALAHARHAGHQAISAWVQAQQPPLRNPRDEVARMRARRRSPKW